MKFRAQYTPQEEPAPARVRAPWDQIEGEPPEAFALFVRFLTHPAGALSRFIRVEGLLVGPTLALAARWRWIARRAAYDGAIVDAGAQAAQETSRDLAREHARILSSARRLLADSLAAALSKNQTVDLDKIPVWLKNVVELERLVAGEATARTAIDLTGASPEALAALDQALGVVEGRAPAPEPEAPN